jgi:alkanesulfonate monooxygenase SsuD/methylene tetrahydromethanopterin reductase-like flavin-dependent oxidoreductase (luciferase family)
MAPKTVISALNLIEARVSGDLLALNRLIMTFLNKRMPVAGFTVGRDGGGMRATILLDCTPETARRYAALLSNLEDVERIEFSGETMEVALLKVETSHRGAETPRQGVSTAWRESASRAGITVHEEGGTIVAVGDPERMEAWLATLGDEVEDIVRLGPIARPGNGGE